MRCLINSPACDLPAWAAMPALTGHSDRRREPGTLCHRLITIPATITHHGDTRQTLTPNRHNQPHPNNPEPPQTNPTTPRNIQANAKNDAKK